MKSLITKTIFIIFIAFQLVIGQLKFAWITDTHIGSPNAQNDLLQIVNDINTKEIKFTIITGDITEKGFNAELELAKEILDQLEKPYFIIPGNHDTKWSESGCTKFTDLFGDDKFIFYYDNYCFIGLNSGIPLRGGGGHISPDDIDWLKSKLNKLSTNTKLIFAVHHQLDNEIDNSNNIIDLLSKFEKVLVIVGHGHSNKTYNFDGLKGVMGRSALSKGKNPGYNIVTLFMDSVSIQTIDFSENKLWYLNSLERTPKNKKEGLDEFQNSPLLMIFDAKATVVKSGINLGKNLFFADLNGFIHSINLNGKLNWKKYFPTSFFAQPIAFKNQIILCGVNGNIYFLNRTNGQVLKVLSLSSPIVASPIIHKNKLVVFTNDGKINFIELKSYRVKSFKIAGKNFEANPLIAEDKILIGNWDNYLYSINANSNDTPLVNWRWTENKNFYYSPAACNPLIDNLKRIFISTPDKFISAINLNSGKTLFRSNEFNSWESIGIDEKKNLLFIKGLVDTLYAIMIKDSLIKLKWKTSLNYGLDTNPVEVKEKFGLVFVSAKNGHLYIVEKETGNLIDKIFLGNARLNDVLIIDSKNIIVSNMDGKFFRINIDKRKK